MTTKDQPVDEQITFGHIEDGVASRYWLRIGKDKVLPVEFADVLVPYLKKLEDKCQAECNRAREDELQQLRMYWFNYSVSVPRETTTPRPVKEELTRRIAELQQLMKEGER